MTLRTIYDLIRAQAERNPEVVALLAPDRAPTSYGRLYAQMNDALRELNAFGLGANDRIAILVPSVPEMAVGFLSISSGFASAPLNPAYRAQEFALYFSELKPKALVIQSGIESAARNVAEELSIPTIELYPDSKDAGLFTLKGKRKSQISQTRLAEPDDIALLLPTSGTTARPKIVPLMQRNICASVDAIRQTLQLSANDRCLNIMPLFHIHGLIGALLASLASGGSVICPPGFYAPSFFDWMDQFQPTWYTAVPSMHRAILTRAVSNRSIIERRALRFIRSSSDSLPARIQSELESVFNVPVIQAYGMTEGSHQIASNPLPPQKRKADSVGLATGSQIAILNEAGSLLANGQTGEVAIRGENVTLGYLENDTANANAFTNDWLRTGDLGYLDSENYLFLVGRIKELINHGGEKISPREVEQVLESHPTIAQATAFGVPDSNIGERVAAAIVLKEGMTPTEREIREFVAARLAHFKVPRQVIYVAELPRGASGKPLRIGLAEKLGLTDGDVSTQVEYLAPRNKIEHALAAIWSEVLRVARIGVRDHFIALGGDSILAALIISRIRRELNLELSIVTLLDETATIERMATQIEQLPSGQAEFPSDRFSFPADKDEIPLSFAQERLWFLSQFSGGNLAYHRVCAIRVKGKLNVTALEHSLNEIIRRHEILRTNFCVEDGQPFQVITPFQKIPIKQIELRGIPDSERELEAQRVILDEARVEFDLAKDSLVRFVCLQVNEQDQILLLITHHIVFDGWSEGIFFNELARGYNAISTNQSPRTPELPIQYADFARWQRETLKSEILQRNLNYWRVQLGDNLPVLEFPTDRPRPALQTFNGSRHSFTISKLLINQARNLFRLEGLTLFMGLLAVFGILLRRYTMQDDIIVGSPVTGRHRVEFENLIGIFVNNLVLRANFSGDLTCRELFARVKGVALGAYAHQDLPFERLVQELQPQRDLSRNPLFQVGFQLRNVPQEPWTWQDMVVDKYSFDPGTTHYDLTLDTVEEAEVLRCTIEYSTDLFDATTIQRMAGHFQVLLEGVIGHPEQRISELPILTQTERYQLLVEWNETKQDYPQDTCIHHLIEKQVERTPDAVAVVFQDQQLTYRELNDRANQLAHYLQKLGVGPEVRVGISTERSLEMIIGLMGILKAGGAYVPLDPDSPRDRLAFMLKDTQLRVLVTRSIYLEKFPQDLVRTISLDGNWEEISHASQANPTKTIKAEHLAYVLYTSGSTGQPKGVMVEHKQLVNYVWGIIERLELQPGASSAMVQPLTWDSCITVIFPILSTGGCLHLLSKEQSLDLRQFAEYLSNHRIDLLKIAPSHLGAFQADPLFDKVLPRRWLVLGGEPLRSDLVSQIQSRCTCAIFNEYGPTETTVGVLTYPVDQEDRRNTQSVPIGKPGANIRAYVLDSMRQLVPIGVPGELYIGGQCVARGYLNRADITKANFVSDPFSGQSGARLYKTGDLVRYLADGNAEFLGRTDDQVKIRGIRIELGEIESVMNQYPGVRQSAVIASEETSGGKRLVAYIEVNEKPTPLTIDLRHFLQLKLPDYMIPASFVTLNSLPLLPNGKVNKRELLTRELPIIESEQDWVSPRTPIEKLLEEMWRQSLGLDRVSVYDNFFELGGHSLLAIQIISRLSAQLQIELRISSLFEFPILADFARVIEESLSGNQPTPLSPIVQVPRENYRRHIS